MGFGPTVPAGSLPVYSVDTSEEAEELIFLACPKTESGLHFAPELAEEQTLENLALFSDRLDRAWTMLQQSKKERGR